MPRCKMARLTLLLTLHHHQPVGNFEHVFEMAWDLCYEPVLEALFQVPEVRLTMHLTGPLLEWLWRERPEYLDRLRAMVERGQVEVLGGGFYEPMLAILPERDALGQLEMMQAFCQEQLGQRPRGAWLAERVWEPHLARLLHRAGVEYTLLDDVHFRVAGPRTGFVHGDYITEKAGHPLRLFPISKRLREMVPFSPVSEVMGVLREALERSGRDELALTFADDAEKFGLWPNTWEWVFERGWLRDFLGALVEAREWLGTSTLGAWVDSHRPVDRIYLPTSSYEEMAVWSLPSEALGPYLQFRERLASSGELETLGPFVRGGIWAGFLTKYPESNALHKRAIRVSRKLQALEQRVAAGGAPPEWGGAVESARVELYRGQCNCALWHGLFGGLYLNWLRGALHEHLIRADRTLDRALHGERYLWHEIDDFELDGYEEVLVASPSISVLVAPRYGASVSEIDLRDFDFCPTDVLTRRHEAYHVDLAGALVGGEDDGQNGRPSPGRRAKEAGLDELVVQDRMLRLNFLDAVYPRIGEDDFLRALVEGTHTALVDFALCPFGLPELEEGEGKLGLRFTGEATSGDGARFSLEKRFAFDAHSPRRFVAHYRLTADQEVRGAWFGVTFNLTLQAPDAPDRHMRILHGVHATDPLAMNEAGFGMGERVELVDAWRKLEMLLTASTHATIIHFPIETVSQSEGGFERTYQGTSLTWLWPLELAAGEVFQLSLAVAGRAHAEDED